MKTVVESERRDVREHKPAVLVHLASGIGNIVLATPLLVALNQMELIVDLLIHADYPQTVDLLRNWSIIHKLHDGRCARIENLSNYDFVIPAVPPFCWSRFASFYRNPSRTIGRPLDSLFYQDEQEYYLTFARELGYPADHRPFYCLPIGPSEKLGVTSKTLVLAPGCKTGEMASKRWPFFTQLAERFEDVTIVGTHDDLCQNGGEQLQFSKHVRLYVGKLTLLETAELLATAGLVIGNDSGLSHIAAAVGTSTLMLFGPTPDVALGQLPPNVKVLRTGLECEPCWLATRFEACASQIHCLRRLTVETVEQEARILFGLDANKPRNDSCD